MRYKMKFLAFTLLFALIGITAVSASDYLIWNPCQQPQAEGMNRLLTEQGYAGVITDDIYAYIDNLGPYRPLIFFPECFEDPDIEQILVDIQDEIGAYLNNQGALYWEGASIALFNDYYRDQVFHFDMATCITEPFNTLYGTSESFETLSFSTYTSMAPMIGGGDGCAFAAIDVCPDKAVFRDGQFRAMLTSFSFGCLTDDGPNNRADYLNAIMGWLTGIVDVPEQDRALPDKIAYIEAYPNPFNIQTRIHFYTPQAGDIKVCIYNILGQPVETLYEGHAIAGEQNLTWNGDAYSTGVYFARLETTQYAECAKLILLK